jgi:hypothetical protein
MAVSRPHWLPSDTFHDNYYVNRAINNEISKRGLCNFQQIPLDFIENGNTSLDFGNYVITARQLQNFRIIVVKRFFLV